jgi:hypothetical protein
MCGGEVGNSLFHNAYAFADFDDSVASDVFEALHEAARPMNLDGIGHGGFAQPKMQAEVTLRDVSTAAAHLLRLLVIANSNGDFGADGVAIGLRAFQFQ